VDFTEDPDHRAIREAVREVCARFPDEYWAERDESHTFPWDFYAAMAKGGWIGIAIPAEYGGGVAYARERVVFGRPIGQNQGISFPLAEAHARLAAAGLAIRHASWRIDHDLAAGEQANLAKFLGSWPARPASPPPTRPCRPTAGSATPASTTSSATGGRPG
jgi:alkylation response protein AidB-like acyl-CoA dehydrogenase